MKTLNKGKTILDRFKKVKKVGICKEKDCDKPRYANTSLCYQHYCKAERLKRAEKLLKKKARHENTKTYEKEVCDKLIKQNDKLFQELCKELFKKCYFGHEYSCAHHWVRKSQSLYCRYDLENVIPVCMKCHCEIHQAQNSVLEARFVIDKGEDWLNRMTLKKEKLVLNKLEFLKEKNKALKNALGKNI